MAVKRMKFIFGKRFCLSTIKKSQPNHPEGEFALLNPRLKGTSKSQHGRQGLYACPCIVF